MLLKIKNILFKILYILIIIYLLVFVPSFFGHKPLVVISGSMEPILQVGGILYYHEQDINDFNIGDIVVYEAKDHIISHRIVDITDTGFITKGDANDVVDSTEINYSRVLGKGNNWSIPILGYYSDFIYRHKYILFISVGTLTLDLFLDLYKNRKAGVKNEEIN